MEYARGVLAELVKTKKVIVCCGAGGVGKTTTSAALGLAAARAGRRVLVLTIDPAKRLAQAMGIAENAKAPTPISPERLLAAGVTTGALDAWMLNPDVVFDSLVRRMARSPQQAERIMASRLFRHLSEMVAGMQEFTAAEALYDLSTSGKYDLVVLDTPPARNALDFLEAPGKLARFLDEKIINLFLPGKHRMAIFRKATELIGSVFNKVFGPEFFAEIQEFLGAFSGMFTPMRQHAEGVRKLLSSKDAAFLLVTSPEQTALTEARYFRDRILAMKLPFAGFVLNRSWARVDGLTHPDALELAVDASADTHGGMAKLKLLAELELKRVTRDQRLLQQLIAELPATAVAIAAPYLGEAIEDLVGLARLARGIAEPASSPWQATATSD
jgi:anion-transporting  ArsA/GET3 family ATPase